MVAPVEFVARNTGHPSVAWPDLGPGDSVHGLTDGRWSMIDALEELVGRATNDGKDGTCGLVIATWTAADADIDRARRLLEDGRIGWARWLLDHSFPRRKPGYCQHLRERFGDEAIRVWRCHAKFAVIQAPRAENSHLYLTSANLNPNLRVENFTILRSGPVIDEYLEMVSEAFERQNPGQGFSRCADAKRLNRELLRDQREKGPGDPDLDLLGGEAKF